MLVLYVVGSFVLFLLALQMLPKSRTGVYVQPMPSTLVAVQAGMDASAIAGLKTLTLTSFRGAGIQKVNGIKAIRLLCPQHDLLAAKYVVEHMPRAIATSLSPAQAHDLAGKLEAAGFIVVIT